MSIKNMFTKKQSLMPLLWHASLAVFFLFLSIFFNNDITYSDVEPILSILQNTSSMVFTIMGIWIAYLYPNAIMKIIRPSGEIDAIFSDEDEQRLRLIVGVVALSAVVMVFLILGTTAKVFIEKTALYTAHPSAFKIPGIFILLSLSYAQVFCIYIVFASNVNFIVSLRSKKNIAKIDKKFYVTPKEPDKK
ncbi:hypothetical protein [Aeromonas veronii]|uniref:hypothetical protein n=1 Tax=Aeromonas veronii TaxID=654 RepID=UPI003B9F0478